MLNTIKTNKGLSKSLLKIFDFQMLDELNEPEDEDGHLTYNIKGKTFGKCGDGSEYILLEDGTIGYWGSEGQLGRIADNIDEFFELIINCPYWEDYVKEEMYINSEVLSQFAKETFEDYMMFMEEDNIDLRKEQKYIAKELGIKLYDNLAEVLSRFYLTANREPKFYGEFTEDDGSKNIISQTLFK